MSYPQLNKPSLELFLDLINRTNDLNFKPGDLNIGAMAEASHPEHTYVNTSIVVTGTGTTTFKGPTTLFYRRLDLNLLFAAKNMAFELPEGTTELNTTTLAALVNARFQTQMDLSDLVDGTWTLSNQGATQIPLTARAGSLTYIGNTSLSISVQGAVEPITPPTVNITSSADVLTAGQSFSITVTADRVMEQNFPVDVRYSEDAEPGVDYVSPGSPIVIPAGQSSVTLQVQTMDDGLPADPDGNPYKSIGIYLERQDSKYLIGMPAMLMIQLDEPAAPGDSILQFRMAPTSGSVDMMDPDVVIDRPAPNIYEITAVTAQGGSKNIPFSAGDYPDTTSPDLTYTMNGLMRTNELDNRRRYAPYLEKAVGNLVEMVYQIPENISFTDLKLRALFTADLADNWSAEWNIGAYAEWGRWIDSSSDTLPGMPGSGENMPAGESVMETIMSVPTEARAIGAGLSLSRLDGRAIQWGYMPTNRYAISVEELSGNWIGEFYGEESEGGSFSTGYNGGTVGMNMSMNQTTFYTEDLEVVSFRMRPDTENDNAALRITVVALDGPMEVESRWGDGPIFTLDTVGQVIDIPEYYEPKLFTSGNGTGRWEITLEIEVAGRDQNDNGQLSTLNMEFTHLQLVGGENYVAAKPSRMFMPCGSYIWPLDTHNRTIIAGEAGDPKEYGGITLLDSNLNAYRERLVLIWGQDPSNGSSTDPLPQVVKGWTPIAGNVTSFDSHPVPSTFNLGPNLSKHVVASMNSELAHHPKFAISLTDGMLIESTNGEENGFENGLKWVYVNRNADTVVGHGIIDLWRNTAIQMVATPVEDNAMIYAYQTSLYGQPAKTYARGIPLLGQAMFDNLVLLSQDDSRAPVVALYNSTQHAGKFTLHDRSGPDLGYVWNIDLPVTSGRIRLYRGDLFDNYNGYMYIVCATEDGRVWTGWAGDSANDFQWVALDENIVYGPEGLDGFEPFVIASDQTRLLSYLGGEIPADRTHALDVVQYNGTEYSNAVSIGGFTTTGDTIPVNAQPNWAQRRVSQYQNNTGGRDTKFSGLYISQDGQKVLRFGGPTYYDPQGPDAPV